MFNLNLVLPYLRVFDYSTSFPIPNQFIQCQVVDALSLNPLNATIKVMYSHYKYFLKSFLLFQFLKFVVFKRRGFQVCQNFTVSVLSYNLFFLCFLKGFDSTVMCFAHANQFPQLMIIETFDASIYHSCILSSKRIEANAKLVIAFQAFSMFPLTLVVNCHIMLNEAKIVLVIYALPIETGLFIIFADIWLY